ncbi:response regulator [Paraburkholderia bryophila]|uniref:response regulator n=1 Tax=Paraburkholderia bryophila TaxID=420952 RepID=UPI00234A7253|nr:response regulator [Paraburkholderia bryophila]WCM18736.1 response regulator [Paraburkholderia bryophila]
MFTILVVEDEPDLRLAFQIILELRGYRVLVAANGKDGLDTATRHLPDLILTDWNMPEMDGEEFCERLSFSPALCSIPLAVISARYPPFGTQRLWDVFLLKPVDGETLELTVARLLTGRLARPTIRPFSNDPAPSRWQPVLSKCWP